MVKKDERDGSQEHRQYKHPHVSRQGRDRAVHLAIVAARWEGSVPPTAQAYSRALAQWRQLPGAIVTAATDLGDAASVPLPGNVGGSDEDELS
jgi:hypothetical protein